MPNLTPEYLDELDRLHTVEGLDQALRLYDNHPEHDPQLIDKCVLEPLFEAAAAYNKTPIPALTAEIRRLRDALKFYADPNTYDANGYLDRESLKMGFRPDVYLIDPIKNDNGRKAREAIAAAQKDGAE